MIGKSLLHYRIEESIGKGGMGEVFRALDTKLGREVAVKILPAELSGDAEREARFQREARALASLQHPNVASVYGFEEADGVRFLVMELVPGSDLVGRIKAGPCPLKEVLPLARQIAAGLEAAHEAGIVHRDLKPANIMETPEGEIKILDFGLAQAWLGDAATDSGSSVVPTLTAAVTQAGAILGTAAYMSPEQARGGHVDRRTDIWAFGVILFELLTGRQLFQGETVSDTLAAVLRAEPEWDALPTAEAPALCRLIERCLERNPKQRLRDIGEARIFLQDGEASGSHLSFSRLQTGPAPAATAPAKRPVALLAVVALACLAGGALLGWQVLARPTPAPILHAMIPPPQDTDYNLRGTAPGPAVISPDGSMVAFTAEDDDDVTRLYLRHLDQGESVAMPGTESAAYPFWSADNSYLGFFDMQGGKLRKVAVAGGPPVTICPASNGKGGSWNSDGDIVFAPDYNTVIHRVPAIGGTPVPLTKLGPETDSHRHPRFLPDGKRFVYVARSSRAEQPNGVYLASLDTSVAPRLIAESQANVEYADGRLLTVRENVLMAAPFTPDQDHVTAGDTPIVQNVLVLAEGAAVGVFSASPTGVMVYQTGTAAEVGRVLAWTDLATGALQPLGEMGQIKHPVISPDGTRAMLQVSGVSDEGVDLWQVDLETGLRTRFTFAAGDETDPVWSRDGAYVFYTASGGGTYSIIQQPVEGQGGAAVVLESERPIAPSSLGVGDRDLLLDYAREDGYAEIRRLDLVAGDGQPVLVTGSEDKTIVDGQYSPDGRWIAYISQSAAGWDVFVMPAEGGARKWQITAEGCVYPKWNTAGTELWCSDFDGQLRAYAVDGSGQTFRAGSYRLLVAVSPPDATGSYYDLHPDGARILQTSGDPAARAEVSYLHVVTDWQRALVR